MKRHLRKPLLAAVSGLTGRTAVLLPAEAGERGAVLDVRAPYRVDVPVLTMQICDEVCGRLKATFEPGEANARWSSEAIEYGAPGPLTLDLATGNVAFDGQALGTVSGGAPVRSRRFCWTFELETPQGIFSRRTAHYLSRDGAPVDAAYYTGEDYRDYEAESGAVHAQVAALARSLNVTGRALEIGCATGGTIAALTDAGFDAVGIDLSEWAVEQARRRVGDRVWRCDVEAAPIPQAVRARAPFDLLVLASVFEHFRRPFEVLRGVSDLMAPGAALILITSNAASLTHRIFDRDWEGYFDWTHHGVDIVSPATLRDGLPRLGWRIEQLTTWHVWDGSDDPTHATVRDWFAADARFRRLLTERELGDFVTCVAVRA